MVALAVDPWLRFGFGVLTGCWIGAAIGFAITLMLAGRRVQELQAANSMLQTKLRARDKSRPPGSGGTGPVLVVPTGIQHPASAPLSRAAAGR
jgi:hypothetical protein